MKILEIQSAKFQVGAVVQERGDGSLGCSLLQDFANVEDTYASSVYRISEYLKLVAKDGPQTLNYAQSHVVDANSKIYEFISGKVRVLFFTSDKGTVVVCSHMFLKKTQKTPTSEVAKAIRARTAYLADHEKGANQWLTKLPPKT